VALITFDAFFTAAETTLSQSFTTASDGQFDYAFKAGRSEATGPFNDVGLTFTARVDGVLLSDLLPAFDGGSGGSAAFTRLLSDYSGSLFLAQGSHQLVFDVTRTGTGFGRGPFFVLDGVSLRAQAAPPGPGVPEPATWAMMIAGFGLAGAALRRRNGGLAPQRQAEVTSAPGP
jgi:hypothetical protein